MKIFKGNRTNYGEAIGILMMDSHFPRIPGDIGNATSFSFPVRYEIVSGANIASVIETHNPSILEQMIAAAQKLEAAGVKAITTSCGFLAIWQREISAAVNIPVFTSSLLQIPFAYAITGNHPVGVITAQAKRLSAEHLKACGADHVPVVVYGLDETTEFNRTFTDNGEILNYDLVEEEVLEVTKKLLDEHQEVKSIVFECSNIPPYANRVSQEFNLPVFDLIGMVNYVYESVTKPPYAQVLD